MSNLIEREKAIRAVAADLMANAILKSADASDNIRDWIPMAEDILSIVPTVDAVPVVRCRDCEHKDRESGFCHGRGWPMQLVPDDGFCDKGKAR